MNTKNQKPISAQGFAAAFREFIMEAPEAEVDAAIRSAGADPKDLLRSSNDAIAQALAKLKKAPDAQAPGA